MDREDPSTSCLLKGMDEVAVCGTREQVEALKTLRQAVAAVRGELAGMGNMEK